MLHREIIDACSDTHKCNMWAERRILECETWQYAK